MALISAANAATSARSAASSSAASRKLMNFSPTRYARAWGAQNSSWMARAASHCSIQILCTLFHHSCGLGPGRRASWTHAGVQLAKLDQWTDSIDHDGPRLQSMVDQVAFS